MWVDDPFATVMGAAPTPGTSDTAQPNSGSPNRWVILGLLLMLFVAILVVGIVAR